MLGGIYSDQRCPACGGILKDDGKKGLSCPKHPDQKATRFKVRFKYRGKEVLKRFTDYEPAQRFLTGLRFQVDQGTFDARDYRKDSPLGFENLALKWLSYKEREGIRCMRNLNGHIARAINHWGNKNIKQIEYADIEDFLLPDNIVNEKTGAPLSDKTRANIKATLHSFWVWLRKRRILTLAQMPEFPEISYVLRWRSTVEKEIQDTILDEVHRLTYHINPKIWIGIKWLATYISIRPVELINIREEDFDLNLGVVNIRYNKEKKPKIVPLLDEDIELVRSFPQALPHIYFFRHGRRKGVHESKRRRFGKDYLYKWWKTACRNLGVEGVDLYGGTRHSSARALREYFSPEQIKKASMHSTNAAFERYFKLELEDVKDIYRKTKKKEGPKGEIVSIQDSIERRKGPED